MKTRKDFEAEAALIRQMPLNKRATAVLTAVEKFSKDNPKFDEKRFREACGVSAPLPSVVSKQIKHQVCIGDIVDYKKIAHRIVSATLNGNKVRFSERVEQRCYPKGHQWAGQVQRTSVSVPSIYREFFGRDYWCGEYHNDDGMVCMGSSYIDLDAFLFSCLFQVKGAEHTESCENRMGPWISWDVNVEDLAEFEESLAHHLNVIKSIKFSLKKY